MIGSKRLLGSIGKIALLVLAGLHASRAIAQLPDTILFGVAYYDEYTPVDRVEEDARMMKAAGITVVRIAESTWGTLEPQPGVFDFSHIDRTLAAMQRNGIKVIIGTPTYAIPTWLARQHPEILVVRREGQAHYGPRQNMDITNPEFRRAAERVIVALVDHVKDNPAVIGYQVDNETKAYGNTGANVQAAFVKEMQRKFPSLDGVNHAFGLDYWSNRINRWEDFPSVDASINASLSNAFSEFQRGLVTEYLAWQAGLVRAHYRPGQFITQNFDLSWQGYSYGVQPEVNHWEAAKALDVAGIDIYYPSQDKLTGTGIAFGGDVARSMKNGKNFLLMETEAQGFPNWTPYPGQLRLQAFSHIASGANMVEYWHWATTANGIETYWRGVLTQDYQPNPTYDEAKTIGADLQRLGSKLVNMKKHNQVAVYVSNTALDGFDAFRINTDGGIGYNQVLRSLYDSLYRMNVEVDLISPSSTVPLSDYKLILVPALYSASDAEIAKLNGYAKAGGHLVYTFKSGFSDENTKVRYASQPGGISEAAGVKYSEFAIPEGVTLDGDPFGVGEQDNKARWWMEFLKPTTATVLARYKHSSWPAYAAVTRNSYGKGEVTYLGFMPTDAMAEKILGDAAKRAGVESLPGSHFPLIVRSGILQNGHPVHYFLNYSKDKQQASYAYQKGSELLSGKQINHGQVLELAPWGVSIVEESGQ
ncbi:beta-galactosidase [Terriglobus sp. 2YAB30_2]|uniref:beta-galactosidase n=2 Tax=unclassified Terriglobus TaxID=2628988 RepID=UPI003F94C1F9